MQCNYGRHHRYVGGFAGYRVCWACWVGGILECPSGNWWNVLARAIESTAQRFMWWTRSIRSPLKNLTLLRRLCDLHCFLVESTCCNVLQHYIKTPLDKITNPQEAALFVQVPHHVPICAHHEWNLDGLIEMVWRYMSLLRPSFPILETTVMGNLLTPFQSDETWPPARIYTKPRGQIPDYTVSFGMFQLCSTSHQDSARFPEPGSSDPPCWEE